MKPSETTVVDEIRDDLISRPCFNKTFVISREKPKGQYLSSLFATASKKDNGNIGRCDIILEEKAAKRNSVVILIECKNDPKKHGSPSENSPVAKKDKAVPGVVHYITKVWSSGNKSKGYTLIGIGVSGIGTQRKITVVGICNLQNVDAEPKIKVLFENINYLPDYKHLLDELYSFKNIPDITYLQNYENDMIISVPFKIMHRLGFSNAFQRHYSLSHKNDIVASLTKRRAEGKSPVLLGVIIVAVYEYKYYIVDGQHRFEAYKEDYKIHGEEASTFFQIKYVETLEEVREAYNDHYKAMVPTESEKTLTILDDTDDVEAEVVISKSPSKKSPTKPKIQKRKATIAEYPEVEDIIVENDDSESVLDDLLLMDFEYEEEVVDRNWAYELACGVFDLMAAEWKIVNDSTAPPNITRSQQLQLLQEFIKDQGNFYIDYSPEDIMGILREKNNFLMANRPTQQKSNPKKIYGELTYKKAANAGCYLGLVWASEWLT